MAAPSRLRPRPNEVFEGFARGRHEGSEAPVHYVTGGTGPPLLLLHGYPQTHIMWRKIAPRLAAEFTVIAADLRGYGDSGKPPSDDRHAPYSKRAMAGDLSALMTALGHESFLLAGHDRGGRVAHRLTLDNPGRVERLAVLDIVPTERMFRDTGKAVATGYYHWYFLIQDAPFPETLIGNSVEFYLRTKLGRWGAASDAVEEEAFAEYLRCFSDPATIHASCEDYRAAATIDVEHDAADRESRIECPLLVLWGERGLMHRHFDVPGTWRERASDVSGTLIPCGHFLPEEAPDETFCALHRFFSAR